MHPSWLSNGSSFWLFLRDLVNLGKYINLFNIKGIGYQGMKLLRRDAPYSAYPVLVGIFMLRFSTKFRFHEQISQSQITWKDINKDEKEFLNKVWASDKMH